MFRRTKVCSAVMLALGGSMALGVAPVFAQQTLERVEITGSSIKRIEAEGALPITVLTQEDIKKTGAVSVTDLIQMLPSMQNFVPASSSVNGSGAGLTTAALHALPSKYTLVLLNGQRVAPLTIGKSQGGGYGVNLESIPLGAIERVEILTDGASATYGSDAIGGVVNFILKKNKTDGDFYLNFNAPQHPGGDSWIVSLSKGFGDLDRDGFNILLAASHDDQDKVLANQRKFSATGAYIPFSANGTNYLFNNRTGNTEPANITFSAVPAGSPVGTKPNAYSLNPYFAANGNCGTPFAAPLTDPVALGATGVSCRFNYAATVQDIPSSSRDSGLVRGSLKLGADATLWSELSLSQFKMNAQFAPAAQPLGVSPTRLPALYNAYVAPFLLANNLTIPTSTASSGGGATLGYRSVSLGGRTDIYETDGRHFAIGIDGSAKGWDYKASLTLSKTEFTDTAAGGYSDFNKFSAAVASGAYDPVLGTGTSSVASAILSTQFEKDVSNLNSLHVGAQHDLFELPGGMSIIALGADYSTTHYTVAYDDLILSQSGFSTQPVSANFPVGGNFGQVPFDASRSNWGVSAEWLLPVVKQLEVTASVRYDSYSKTHSKYVFSEVVDPVSGLQNQVGDADLGNTFSATTGKLSLRYTPVESVLLRASYGTGFKAPNINDIAGATTFAGNTSGSYACPFPNTSGCLPGTAQYDLLAGANGLSGSDGLKPEKSKQWTLGFRVDPFRGLSLGLDVWDVKIKDQVLSQGIAEQVGFANPSQYAGLFVNPYTDPGGGFTTIGFKQLPFNGGDAEYRGIDWDLSYRTSVGIGNLTVQWTGTQMLKQQYNFGPGLPFNTDLGVYGPDQQVVFRTISHLALTLQTGSFSNTLTVNYKSGYQDQAYPINTDIFLRNPDGSLGSSVAFAGLKVPSYTTFDWQAKVNQSDALQLTVGIKNLLDRDPPLTLQSGGGGNQIGYDGRYANPIGRQFYVAANYKF